MKTNNLLERNIATNSIKRVSMYVIINFIYQTKLANFKNIFLRFKTPPCSIQTPLIENSEIKSQTSTFEDFFCKI